MILNSSNIMRCIAVNGSDNRMDCRDLWWDPLNPIPKKCLTCGFPDLDHVPQPYYLRKSLTMTSSELASAAMGNLLVRDRVRRILELLVPGQCEFHPTCFTGTPDATPWTLAVPKHQVETALVDPAIPSCPTCKQPRSAHPGTQYAKWLWNFSSKYDVLKASTWGSSEEGWDKWMQRDTYMSVRLYHLLKKSGAKGLYEQTCDKETTPDNQESDWIREKIALLNQNDLLLNAKGALSKNDAKWLQEYANRHASPQPFTWPIRSLEKSLGFGLPKSYVEFISKVGPLSFENVDGQEGFVAHVLVPEDLDCKSYRAGMLKADDEDTSSVDGLMFARTDHGDCFCFNLKKDRKEYRVFHYQHESNCFEPYAESFAACVKRFAKFGEREPLPGEE